MPQHTIVIEVPEGTDEDRLEERMTSHVSRLAFFDVTVTQYHRECIPTDPNED